MKDLLSRTTVILLGIGIIFTSLALALVSYSNRKQKPEAGSPEHARNAKAKKKKLRDEIDASMEEINEVIEEIEEPEKKEPKKTNDDGTK